MNGRAKRENLPFLVFIVSFFFVTAQTDARWSGPSDGPPLSGLRVLDLTTYTPGPFGTQLLADLGATVLKVERPPHGDPERLSIVEYFLAYNRGKHSVAVDTKKPADLAFLLDLAARAHVLFEGFRPGATDRMGIGFDAVARLNPNIVYVSLPGFPSEGPFAQDRAHDREFQARMGALDLFPKDSAGAPVYESPYHVADYAAGMYAVVGALSVLAAPVHGPVHLEAPVFAAGLAWAFPVMYREAFAVAEPPQESPASGLFPTGDGRLLSISVIEDSGWGQFCRVLELDDLVRRDDLATLAGRRANAVDINRRLREVFATRTLEEWEQLLRAANLSFGPVRTVSEGLQDEAVQSLGLLRLEPSPHIGAPIFGLPTVTHPAAPELNSAGDAVRAGGWAALEDAGDGATHRPGQAAR
jgi:crotonobetainyl-CoA:carnitine CoA-transferase CaiB-like acyl-CoA transferase